MSGLAIYLSVGLITLLLLGVPVAFTLAILAITGLYL
jgi:hypothetical protein